MSDDRVVNVELADLQSREQLLAELNRLRIIAGRQRGKVRLSLQDLESATGVPKSSLANYLTGRTLMPADVLDRLVIALGVSPEASQGWATAWEQLPPSLSAPTGECSPPPEQTTRSGSGT